MKDQTSRGPIQNLLSEHVLRGWWLWPQKMASHWANQLNMFPNKPWINRTSGCKDKLEMQTV